MISSSRRVVITGMGLVTPIGNDVDELWNALTSGQSGVAMFQSVPTESLPTSVAAEARAFTGHIDDFGPLEKDKKKAIRKGLKVMCRESQMGVASAQKAISHCGVEPGSIDPERGGVVFGSDYMLTLPEEFSAGILKCAGEEGFEYPRWGTEGMEQMTPLWLLKYLPNMPASHIAIYNDLRGPNNSITHRESAANLAIGEAYHTILRGSADFMLAGATGTRVHPMKAVHAAQSEQLAPGGDDPAKASRPFDAGRNGMVLGEGAGVVILEEMQSAEARGATIFAEVIGAASSSVADRNLVADRRAALANAMRAAMRAGDVGPEDIGHVNAHGLSTVVSDAEEALAIKDVFGDRASQIPLVAVKSYFGNLGAGSGVVELIASVLALGKRSLFPVLNFETPDPECDVAPVREEGQAPGDSFLNLNVTPQGQAAAVLVRRVD